MERRIDSHCHIYPEKIARKAVEGVRHFYEGQPLKPLDGTRETLLKVGRAHGISQFVVHSVATTPAQVSSINRFIAESQEMAGGAFIGLGAMHPEAADLAADLEEVRRLGLHGVKIHPDIQQFAMDSPAALAFFEMCEDEGVRVLAHTGDYRFDYSNPERVARVLRRFPNLQMVGAHFGGWSVWEEAERRLCDFPNFRVDTSSSFYLLTPERALELIRAFGAERVMFGTDYPVWEPGEDIEFLDALPLSENEREQIWFRTCEEFYGLTPPESGK